MSVDQFVNDLRYAQTTGVCVEARLSNGERLLTGVHSVDEAEGSVSLHAPQHFGDDATRRRVYLADIVTLAVTDVRWSN